LTNKKDVSSYWDVEEMLRIAYYNKYQKEGDENKFTETGSYTYKHFESFDALRATFASATILKTLNLFLEKHNVFHPSVIPDDLDPDTYSLDIKSAVLHGPFIHNPFQYMSLEQQQCDKPLFVILWKPNNLNWLEVDFHKPSKFGRSEYCVAVNENFVFIKDKATKNYIIEYKVNSDGTLGERTI
jgi:hypothetical protein